MDCITANSEEWVAHVQQISNIGEKVEQTNRGVFLILLLAGLLFMMAMARK